LAKKNSVVTLSLDIGGTGLKAMLLDDTGAPMTDRVRVETPRPCPPKVLLKNLKALVSSLPPYDRISAGFPGVVRKGRILTAPNLGTADWHDFDLASALSTTLGKPAQVINDAEMQGLAAIRGHGVELVITLGTGVGSGLFEDGRPSPHLELAHHPFRNGETYEEQLGNKAFLDVGTKRWNKRVERAIKTLRILTTFDRLYFGGGNAEKIEFDLPADVERVSNVAGLRGGIWLWIERPASKKAAARIVKP
jgi:polyphosphate glucokinase